MLLEVQELLVERRAFGNEIRLADPLEQQRLRELAACELGQQVANSGHADDVVDVLAIDGQAIVRARLDDREVVFPRAIEVEADDLLARHHDVVDGDGVEVEDAEQHALVAARHHHAGFRHDGAQLLGAQRVRCDLIGPHAEQPQQAVREQVQQPDDRVRHLEQREVDQRRRQRDSRGGFSAAIVFGATSEKISTTIVSDESRREDRAFAADPQREDRHERQPRRVRRGVAEQDQPDQPVGPLQEPLGDARGAVAGARLMPQPIAVEAHQRGFGAGEKRRQHEQDDDKMTNRPTGLRQLNGLLEPPTG